MNHAVAESEDADLAGTARGVLVEQLLGAGFITMPAVEAAFRVVPRHAFVPPGTPLEEVYAVDRAVITKRDEHGGGLSSVSATYIQARMIEQAGVGRGMRVLEIGSGGYNAALLAEVVGAEGRVVSVDIDADIVDRARELLQETGYGDRVQVLQADAEHGVPGRGVFDRILVTVGAWDIAPAWLAGLADDGVIVVPLRMNGVTRTIAFGRDGDHLVSSSSEVAGFVPMQGDGARPERILRLPDGGGRHISLQFDAGFLEDPAWLDGVLAAERVEVWSGVTIEHGVSFADLHMWFAGFLPGFCRVAADEDEDLAPASGRWFPFGAVRDDSFSYLITRPTADDTGVEFGAAGYGPPGNPAATAMVEQIRAWDERARGGPAPSYAYWPAGTAPGDQPSTVAVLTKAHGLLTISWPAAN